MEQVERRASPRHRVLKKALLVVHGRSTLACTVRNLSETGALVRLETSFGVPDQVELMFDNRRHRCRVARRTATDLGVALEYPAGVPYSA